MIAGYVEFEFDLPGALLARIVKVFDGLTAAPLLRSVVETIPEEQGVYQLFLDSGAFRAAILRKQRGQVPVTLSVTAQASKSSRR
jgi:hypothetical protein